MFISIDVQYYIVSSYNVPKLCYVLLTCVSSKKKTQNLKHHTHSMFPCIRIMPVGLNVVSYSLLFTGTVFLYIRTVNFVSEVHIICL